MKHNYLSTRILWVFLLIIFTTPIALGQSFTENFSQTGPDLVTSFSRNYSGVQFDYLFTSDGDGGDFVHNESGGNLNILSADLNDATTERVTIQRNDGNSFVFNSIYIDNIGGNNPSHNVVVTGKFNGSTVSSQVMNFGNIGTLNFGSGSGIIVDLIEITAGGFEPILVDDFTGAVSVSNTAPTAASFTTANGPFEDFGYVFTTAAFGYTDSDSDPLAYLLIESLPTVGRLYLDTNNNDAYNGGEEVYANQQISRADLDAGNLQYVQNGSTNTSFQFEVSDGTATSTGNYIATLAVIPKPSVSLAVSPTTVSENGGSATLTATLSNSYGRDVEVNLVNYGTATSSGIDFNFSRSITIPAGNTSGTGTINIQEDRLDEEDETIIIAINTTVNSYENGNQEVTVTILDNDEPPLVSINSVSSSESAGLLTFTVSLSAQSQKRITVDYATADQTALALSDYISQSGTITFSPGETSKTITVQLLDDDIFENDEQFFIDLFGTTNADVIPTRRGVGTILNDDSRPNISSVAVPTDKTYQLGGTLDFTVNFSENVTVNTMGGTPQLDFLLGSETKAASYLSGSGTSALVFRYTVALNDYDADGISINTLATNGSTIQNASGTDAALGLKSVGDTSGVLVDARDGDGDGTPDSSDACPTDPNKINPGACGCGVPDSDTDSDGVPDCLDACPIDPNKTNPGACGCGIADVDSDGDGLADCIDPDPLDPSDSEAFVTTWRITMPNESITIPTEGGGYNYSVAWGDGETNAGLTGDATHTYAAAGTYKVSIRGDFPRIFFNNTGTSKDKIIEINQWGTQVWTRFDSAFNGCTNLTIENASDIPQFSTNTSLYAMFANCINFNADLNDWDLSNVIETNFMFAYASSFKGEISDWNMANVTNIQSMFRGATAFNQPIGTWNVGQVQLMDNLFNGAENFDQDLSNWNTGNVTTMRGMFFAARLFKSDIGNWNTEKVTDMSNMLRSANAFNQDIGSWDVSQVTDLSFMLFDTPLFNQDLGDWDVSAVTNAENMFAGSSLSLANYDALLTGWFTIDTGEAPLQTGVDFSAGSNQYCQAGAERQALINTYSWIITDGGVEDIAPTPDVITLADITAECSVTTLTPPTASDNCAATVTVTNDATLPITAQGTTVVTWTYDDGNGNVSTQTQNVIIEDVTDPVGDVANLPDITAQCEVTSLTAPTATDNCATTVTVTNDAILPITTQGTTVVIWTYDDGNGNTSTQTQNVIIEDVTDPVGDLANLPDITAQCKVTSLTAPTATDNCASTVTVTNDAILPITTQGTTVVIWTYDDGNGNVSTQMQNVIIDDVTAPVADVTTLADVTAECEVTSLTAPTATDNCATTVTVTNNASLPITAQGTTVVTWTYNDGNGNVSTQTQNVIIEDVTDPVGDVANLPDITAQCEVTSLTAPTASDNCAATVTVTNDATLPITAQGTTVVTWTYDDGNGNVSTQTQNVIIEDVTDPVADVTTLADITAECEVTSLTAPTATDNCATTVTVTNNASLPITAQGTTVITWTYDDGNENVSTQTQNVIIDDVTAPVADVTTLADVTAECEVTSLTAPTATDNCATTVTVTNNASLPITAQGTTVVTWTYDDGNGNVSTQTQNVIIEDVTAPVADVITLADITAECSVTTLTLPTATDNCATTVTVTNNASLPITAQGTTVVTWTYDDGNGNVSTQTQNVIIEDVTDPVGDVANLPDITAQCEVTSLTAPTATDNCATTVTVTNDAILPITTQGTTVVIWTYDDGNGNTSTQTQNVIIEDVTDPVGDLANLPDITAQCEVTSLTAPTATDNCASTVTVTNDAILPITAQGTTVVTWTYDDGNGNVSTQTQNVIIEDVTDPVGDVANLPDITAQCEVTSLTAPTASDNCAATVTVTNDATLPITAQGTTVVIWTYDDGNGNVSTQTQNVIIEDVTDPVADVTTLADITAECEVTSLTAPTATDNCATTIMVTNNASLPITTQGTTVVTWTYDDGNGNVSTQTQNVIIDDVTAPVADVTTLVDITAECSVTTLTPPTATDNCATTVTVSNDATLPITTQGTTVVTWTYDDGNGNVSTQMQNVIIDDVTAPVADVTTLADITAECEVNSLTAPTATDNCASTVTVTSDATLPITTQGTTVVTWTYDDGNGNVSTQTQNVIIEASPLAAVIFEDQSFVYDGTVKNLEVANVPSGATVTYTNNAQLNAGVYEVSAFVTSPNATCPDQTFTATLTIAQAPQEITFNTLDTVSLESDADFQLTASASSGLPVTYSYTYSGTTPAAMVSASGFVSLVQSGTITITASQEGDTNYLPAAVITQDLLVTSNDARIRSLRIGTSTFDNPSALTVYSLDCDFSADQITVSYETEANATGTMPRTFTVEVPKPGVYRSTIVVTSQDGSATRSYEIEIYKRFLFEEIVEQKFNNTLLVNNNPLTNGGYRFIAYTWYKNGRVVGNDQYFSEGDASSDLLDPLANYRVELTTENGDVLSTCTFNIQLNVTGKIYLAPNPVLATGSTTLFADFDPAELKHMKVSILSLGGTLIDSFYTDASKSTLQMPANIQAGVYLLVCETSKQTQSVQFIVY